MLAVRVKEHKSVSTAPENGLVQEYVVKKIMKHRINKKKREFRIRWKDYGPAHDSWEPEENLQGLTLFKQYIEQHFLK